MNVTEKFELPQKMDVKVEKLAKYISSLFLHHYETLFKYAKKQGNEEKLNSAIDKLQWAKKNRKETENDFRLVKKHVDTQWGPSSFIIYSKDKSLPSITLRITNGYNVSVDGYVMTDTYKVYFLVDQYHFLQWPERSFDEMVEILKHELRHYHQFTGHKTDYIGLPKRKVLNTRGADIFGDINIKGYNAREKHHMRDIEFKTNQYTYGFKIKRYLNSHYPKKQWLHWFKQFVSGKPVYTGDSDLDNILDNIDDMREKDFTRWKQFIKELYKEIFK